MKYALNVQKGSTVNHPTVGRIEGGKAIQVSDNEANQLKHIINIVIFDEVKQPEPDLIVQEVVKDNITEEKKNDGNTSTTTS